MTTMEAAMLKPGDRVLVSSRNPHFATVLRVGHSSMTPLYASWVIVRRVGHDKLGRRFGISERDPHDLSHAPTGDALSANVYADWLEEHGESRAAAKLRSAFPIDDGKGG